jgi:hypothetical protein
MIAWHLYLLGLGLVLGGIPVALSSWEKSDRGVVAAIVGMWIIAASYALPTKPFHEALPLLISSSEPIGGSALSFVECVCAYLYLPSAENTVYLNHGTSSHSPSRSSPWKSATFTTLDLLGDAIHVVPLCDCSLH